jgi:hypothetical protein
MSFNLKYSQSKLLRKLNILRMGTTKSLKMIIPRLSNPKMIRNKTCQLHSRFRVSKKLNKFKKSHKYWALSQTLKR